MSTFQDPQQTPRRQRKRSGLPTRSAARSWADLIAAEQLDGNPVTMRGHPTDCRDGWSPARSRDELVAVPAVAMRHSAPYREVVRQLPADTDARDHASVGRAHVHHALIEVMLPDVGRRPERKVLAGRLRWLTWVGSVPFTATTRADWSEGCR